MLKKITPPKRIGVEWIVDRWWVQGPPVLNVTESNFQLSLGGVLSPSLGNRRPPRGL